MELVQRTVPRGVCCRYFPAKNSLPTTHVEFPCSVKGCESYLDIALAEAEILTWIMVCSDREAGILAWVFLSWQRLKFLPCYLALAEVKILAWLYFSWQRLRFSPGFSCPGWGWAPTWVYLSWQKLKLSPWYTDPGRSWNSHLGILVLVLAEAGILTWVYWYLSWQRLGFSPGYTCPGRGWDSWDLITPRTENLSICLFRCSPACKEKQRRVQ